MWANLGLVSLEWGVKVDVAEKFKRALDLDPNHGLAMNGLALFYAIEGEEEKARAFITKAQAAHPANPFVRFNAKALQVSIDTSLAEVGADSQYEDRDKYNDKIPMGHAQDENEVGFQHEKRRHVRCQGSAGRPGVPTCKSRF